MAYQPALFAALAPGWEVSSVHPARPSAVLLTEGRHRVRETLPRRSGLLGRGVALMLHGPLGIAPERLSGTERITEIGEILALGLIRLNARQSSELFRL